MNNNCLNILKWTEAQLKYTYDVSLQEATPQELHEALGEAVMMAISDDWSHSKKTRMPNRKAYYISAEYLIGRLVYSNLFNLGILDEMKELFAEHGVDLAVLEDIEDDALGNGGLGRLAACFLDSAASTDIPLSGYGLRYKFGLFKQSFDADGSQVENADDWTKFGDPWSFRRYNHTVKVKFPDHTVLAVPYDVPVIGYGTENVGTLRLWQCEAEEELNFDAFNAQDYVKALEKKNKAEDITRVLYPNDSTWEGKRLRVKQQYVLSSASLQDILRDYRAHDLPTPERIYGWDSDPERRKPAPWPIYQIERELGLRPEQLVVIDDLKPGKDMADRAGVDFIAAGWTHTVPHIIETMQCICPHYCRTVAELAALLLDETEA